MIVGNQPIHGGKIKVKKNNKENLTIISVEIPKEMLEKLNKYAEETYTTRSSIIRLALKKFIDNEVK